MYTNIDSLSLTTFRPAYRLTFVVEAVDSVDARALVIPAEEEEIFGVFNFVREEQAYGLQRLLPSVENKTRFSDFVTAFYTNSTRFGTVKVS